MEQCAKKTPDECICLAFKWHVHLSILLLILGFQNERSSICLIIALKLAERQDGPPRAGAY